MDKVKKYLPWAAVVLAALAVVFFFACDVMKVDFMGVSEGVGNGFETTFGKKEAGETVFKFNFMGLVTVLLAVAALVLSVLYALKGNDLMGLVAAACFVVAAIFFFSTKGFVLTANDGKEYADMYKLAIGSILAGILSIVGAVAVAVPVVLKKLGK